MKFRFKIKEYFFLQNGQIGITGDMDPIDFPIVTIKKFKLYLISNAKILHTFTNIGEEIPSTTLRGPIIRAFRTTDDISLILKREDLNNLYIIGESIN